MAASTYPFVVELRNSSGEPLTGLTLNIKKQNSADPAIPLEEMGNGWYKNDTVYQGVYQLYKLVDTEFEFTGEYYDFHPGIFEEAGGFRATLDDRIKLMYKTPNDFAADGFSFNAEAINDAIYYAQDQGVNKVILPTGTYVIESKIELKYPNFILEGQNCTFQMTTTADTLLDITDDDCTISGITFDGYGYLKPDVEIDSADNTNFRNCKFTGGSIGVDFLNGDFATFDDCEFEDDIPFKINNTAGGRNFTKVSISNSRISNQPEIDDYTAIKAINNWGFNWGSSNKYAVKSFTSISSAGPIAALTFNNLLPNTTYVVSLETKISASGDYSLSVQDSGAGDIITQTVNGLDPSPITQVAYHVMVGDTITVELNSILGTSLDEVIVSVEEKSGMYPTTDWD